MQQSGGDRSASAAVLPLLGLGFFGALSLINAAAVLSSTATDTISGYGLAVMPLDGGIVVGLVLLGLAALDLLVAWGLYRVRMWAWWAGFVAFALHGVAALFTSWLFPVLVVFPATGLLVERRAFRLAR